VPRDIAADVQQLPNVYLYDVDDLEVIVRENVRHREQELARCGGIIAEHAREVLARFAERPVEAGKPRDSRQPGFTLFQPAVCGNPSF
jgi:glutamyl-tRNA reductase